MARQRETRTNRAAGGLLRRLQRDASGNTLAIMAAAMIPLAAVVGSGMDLARTYLVQSRLQQACDAGVLAGRRSMTGIVLSSADKAQANNFFNFNFPSDMFRDVVRTFIPTDGAAGAVVGTATARVPMTLMSLIFKKPVINLAVNCESRLDIANTDVMFVLDVTGSMACTASDSTSACLSHVGSVGYRKSGSYWLVPEKSGSRIAALRTAVGLFYDALASSAGQNTRLRFGFVPYSTTVNVGDLIPAAYITKNWNYQSRYVPEWYGRSGPVSRFSFNCRNFEQARTPRTGYDSNGRAQAVTVEGTIGFCNVTTITYRPNYAADTPEFDNWRYEQVAYDLSKLTGTGTVNYSDLAYPKLVWGKCIEEAMTSPSSSFSMTKNPDLNIDLVPDEDANRWHPYLPDLIHGRKTLAGEFVLNPPSSTEYPQPSLGVGNASCPKAAQKLKEMKKADITDYTSAAKGFVPHGGTYHDIGMIWGGRLLSPDGLFKADNASPNGQEINRNIVFITDGDMQPGAGTYSAYGMEKLDRRVMGTSGNDDTSMKARHNARFLNVCNSIKDKQITIWVVAYAQTMTDELKECATDASHAISAPTDAVLKTRLADIATRIAALRLSK
ncbi:TadE/TadG family type IV pilus assembly protein [Sphingomonas arantia]|uniref:TadE/TadG family type IV pilus assembly protein n=1 Tax=Sphingomonas arantia TaxID=1460676 RepID=A0ABW4TWN4_9SPHN